MNMELSILEEEIPPLLLNLVGFILNAGAVRYLWKKQKTSRLSNHLLLSLAFSDALFTFIYFIANICYIIDDYEPESIDSISLDISSHQLIKFSIFASIFHVLAISFNRLLAVLSPFNYKRFTETNLTKYYLLCIWTLTTVVQGSMAIYEYTDGVEKSFERREFVDKTLSCVIFISGCILCIVYTIILYRLRTYRIPVPIDSCSSSRKKNRGETSASIIAMTVSIGFIIFTFPVAIVLFNPEVFINIRGAAVTVVCLLICNSIFNPIIYFWRRRLKKAMRRRFFKQDTSSQSSKHKTDSGVCLAKIPVDTSIDSV